MHPKNFLRSHTLMTSTHKLHGYTYTLMAPQQTRYKMVVLEVLIYLPNGETLEAASATGKYCTNYDAEVKALEQGAKAVIDLTDANSENVVFLTDSRSVLDSLAGHGEHNLRRKLYSILEHRRVVLQWIPAHCGIKGNEHADRLAKQGANMEQEKLPITLKQKRQ